MKTKKYWFCFKSEKTYKKLKTYNLNLKETLHYQILS